MVTLLNNDKNDEAITSTWAAASPISGDWVNLAASMNIVVKP